MEKNKMTKMKYSMCCACRVYKNPETGKFDPNYTPKEELTIENLSHDYCDSCYEKAMTEADEEDKKIGKDSKLVKISGETE